MWEFIRQNQFLVGAATGGVAAFLLKLVPDYFQRERKWIGYSVSSRSIIERGHPDLTITYKNRGINRLSSHTVQVRNIGNRALKDLPVRISLPAGGEIVEHEIQTPPGAKFTCALETPTILRVDCDLLNREESFIAGVTTIDALSDELDVVARGENLLCKEISPQVKLLDLIDILASSSSITRVLVDITRVLMK